ncbi:hypothetical protein B0H14DRAFT_2616090 [Mycena olivaceomarginata]|nr:hypothetical protein B0H14DRAFT_2616090 [Mycena olivaceomarginata]
MDIHSQNPVVRRRDEAQWPYRSRLPARAILPFSLTDGALDAARGGRNDVLGTVPSTRFSRIRFCASLRAFSLAMRRSRAAEIVACPQTHLHRFHDDAERPCPAARDPSVRPIDISRGASLVTQTSPHSGIPTVQLKARFPPSHVGGVHCRIANHDIAICSSNAIHRARSEQGLALVTLGTSPRSRRCTMHPHRKLRTRMCVAGRTPTPSRYYIYVAGRYGYREWGHAARMRTGVIRAKEKDERGRHFHGCSTYGSTTTARSRPEPAQAFPPRLLVLIHVCAGISASNNCRYVPVPLRTPLDDF